MAIGKPFSPGRDKTGGRTVGSRNKYSKAFDDDLRAVYAERGIGALRVAAVDHPVAFLQLFDKRNPAEFATDTSVLTNISDEVLSVLIEEAERRVARRRAAIEDFASGENQATAH